MKLLPPDQQALIEDRLAQQIDHWAASVTAPSLVGLMERVRQYVLDRGKRVRPQLCIWTYLACGETELSPAVLDVACVWEVFHAFLLMHDDVIDVADTRRHRPSMHRQLQSLDHDSARFGENLAIVAGDLLFGFSIRLLSEMDAPPALVVRLMRLFSHLACTTGLGQAMDIVQASQPMSCINEETLRQEYDWKTAAYTFEGPMLSGAVLAGADEPVLAALSRFARSIGQAYQLQNDLEDLSRPAAEGCDMLQGKRTVTLLRARSQMPVDARNLFDHRLESMAFGNGNRLGLAEQLRLQVCQSGAIEQTRALITELLHDAQSAASDAQLPPQMSTSLQSLAATLAGLYFQQTANRSSCPPAMPMNSTAAHVGTTAANSAVVANGIAPSNGTTAVQRV